MEKIIIFDETDGHSIRGNRLKRISKVYDIPYVTNVDEFRKALEKEALK